MGLAICPISISDAKAFVAACHRHHRAPTGGLFAVAAAKMGQIVGVAIVGRPVARALVDGYTAEVVRLASDGSRNACSLLYGAAWRACRALGYRRLITYTLPSEGGASVRAAGFRLVGRAGGGSWSCPSRPRVDRHPLQEKLRWELGSAPGTGVARPSMPDNRPRTGETPRTFDLLERAEGQAP
jgi:hypothetical protein